MDIQLNFINNSNDANNSQVVIFQKNVATDFDELAVAWQVVSGVLGSRAPAVPAGATLAETRR